MIRRACTELGIQRRVTVHGLRHTANDLLRRVADEQITRAILGHTTERMTHHYSHVDEQEKRAAAERAYALVAAKGVEKGVMSPESAAAPTGRNEESPAISRG